MENDRDFLYSQLVKLGDMMGDGLHHEPDGKWISTEYRKISKILFPDQFKKQRQLNSDRINKAVQSKILVDKCNKCEGKLKQTRSGSFVVICESCSSKFKYKQKKN